MESNQHLNILIHELGNALFSISGLLLDGNFQKAKEKISKIFGDLNIKQISKFVPIELLIESKVNIMRKHNIEFSVSELEFPKVDESYLCIIFGNILDNAINFSLGCDNKFISVKFKKTNKFYIYLISNNFLNDENRNSSEKRSKMGIKNVMNILKRINGKAKFKIKKNNFFATIFLPYDS